MAVKRGKKWQVRLRTPQKYYRPTFNTLEEANAWETSARLALSKGNPIPDPANATSGRTLGRFVDDNFELLWGGTKNEASVRRLVNNLVEHFGSSTPLVNIDTLAYDAWMNDLKQQGNSDSTLNRKTSALSKLLKKAKAQGFISELPETTFRKEGQGRLRWVTDEEETKMLGTFAMWDMTAEMHFATFLLYTGCRDSEAKRLKWVDVEDGRVTFYDTKNTFPRTIPMPAKAQQAIRWARQQGWSTPWEGINYNTFIKHWGRMRWHIGLGHDEQFIPYALRHTCASRLVRGGIDLRRVKEWMGHKSIQTTLIYAHLAPDDLLSATEALDRVVSQPLRVVGNVG